jgi:polysaccharide biosynthesis protein PslH
MNILYVLPYSPEPPISGGPLRIHYLLKHLIQHHRITLLCFGTYDTEARLRAKYARQVDAIYVIPLPWASKNHRLGQLYSHITNQSSYHLEYYSKEMQAMIDQLVHRNTYDIIHAEFFMMGTYSFNTKAIRFIDAHNVEYDVFRRMEKYASSYFRKWHYRHEYKKLLLKEIETYRKQDALLVTSSRDKKVLDLAIPGLPKFVIPNGVDTSFFMPSEQTEEEFSMIFTGMMGYIPNFDGMMYFLDEIFPLVQKQCPRAKLYIVGNQPPKELLNRAGENVVVTGFVKDVRPYIRKSSVFVVPLRMGGGTRLKISEALAMKRPIVTTSIGCEGIDVRHGESVLIADDPNQFAQSIIDLFGNKSLRGYLAENGYNLVREKYDWSLIGKQMELAYQGMARELQVRPTQWKVHF